MFSVSIFGQVQVVKPIGSKLNLTPTPVFYIDQCTRPNYYPCALAPNTICVDDGKGEFHCECKDNYVKSDNGACVDLCHKDVNPCGNLLCDENIIDGQAICLMEHYSLKNKEHGVLVCDDYGLAGRCYIFYDNFKTSGFKSLKVLGNWEVFTREEDQRQSTWELPFEYIDNSDEVYNFLGNRYLTIQPKDYETFALYYGTLKHYIEIKTHSFREVFKEKGTFNRGVRGFTITSISTNSGLKVIGLPESVDITDVNEDNNTVLFTHEIKILDSYEDISDGLVVCNIDSCKGFQTHGYYYDEYSFSKNWPITTGDSSSPIIEEADSIYLHEGWEALVCRHANSLLSNCKKIVHSSTGTYENWNVITGGFIPRLLIVQPSTKEKLKEVTGDNYTILYSEPNYQGNSIAFYKKGERVPNPIKQVRSILNKGDVNTYLNKNKIGNFSNNNKKIVTSDDNYLHTTDSTSWVFDNPKNLNLSITPSLSLNTIFLTEKSKYIKNEGIRIKGSIDTDGVNFIDYDNTYQGKVVLSSYDIVKIDDLTSIEIYEGWEVYFCSDIEKNYCAYFNEDDDLYTIKVWYLSNSWYQRNYEFVPEIKYMFVQPTNHKKINQVYGHKEYNEYRHLNALEGVYRIA